MRKHSRLTPGPLITARARLIATAFAFCLSEAGPLSAAAAGPDEPLRVAVYDLPPYGSVGSNGLFYGASVDLWRRVAEDLHWPYRFTSVSQIDTLLTGLERGQFDVGIGAITITPEREARVEFSYPAHRSGVAVALRREAGPIAAILAYGGVVKELASLLVVMVALLLLIGTLIWAFERPRRITTSLPDSAVVSLSDGIYLAIVTMTTVGYGDKTPKTRAGRFIAVVWMLGSLALISLLSTSLVAHMTADRIEAGQITSNNDLAGKRLAAVAASSGAEYLDEQHLPYTKYVNLEEALTSLANGRSDAVVNSVGALQYLISDHFSGVIPMPRGLLAPAYIAFALPPNSSLKRPLDRALIRVTSSVGWRSLEDSYFEK